MIVKKTKTKTATEIALRVPKGSAHFLRGGAGAHGIKSRKTERRAYKQALRANQHD